MTDAVKTDQMTDAVMNRPRVQMTNVAMNRPRVQMTDTVINRPCADD